MYMYNKCINIVDNIYYIYTFIVHVYLLYIYLYIYCTCTCVSTRYTCTINVNIHVLCDLIFDKIQLLYLSLFSHFLLEANKIRCLRYTCMFWWNACFQ